LAQILFGGDSKSSEKKEPNNGNGKKILGTIAFVYMGEMNKK
jgi:hypothetical protein